MPARTVDSIQRPGESQPVQLPIPQVQVRVAAIYVTLSGSRTEFHGGIELLERQLQLTGFTQGTAQVESGFV